MLKGSAEGDWTPRWITRSPADRPSQGRPAAASSGLSRTEGGSGEAQGPCFPRASSAGRPMPSVCPRAAPESPGTARGLWALPVCGRPCRPAGSAQPARAERFRFGRAVAHSTQLASSGRFVDVLPYGTHAFVPAEDEVGGHSTPALRTSALSLQISRSRT